MHNNPHHSIVTFDILIGGKSINPNYQVLSCQVERAINKISRAELILADGDTSQASFPISESEDFKPGVEIAIKAGYDAKNETIFMGIIIGQRIQVNEKSASTLSLSCVDKACKMTLGRKSRLFEKKKDSQILSQVIKDNGLEAKVDATTYQHLQLVQYNVTDWDFIVTRAEANGLVVNNQDGEVKINAPKVSGDAVLELTYGIDILKTDLQLNAQAQIVNVLSKSWDAEQQKTIEEKSQEPSVNKQGNISGKDLAEVLKVEDFQLESTALEKDQLKNWANGEILRTRLSRIQGSIECWGNEKVYPDTLLKIAGLGARFIGEAYVTGVIHLLEGGTWRTQAKIGLQAEAYAHQTPNLSGGAGLLPVVGGLQIGTVKQLASDPEDNFRILVEVPMIGTAGKGIWARISNFYATAGAGSFFLPEVGDEVVLGFLNDDPRNAVILGMLYSKKQAAPFLPDAENNIKGIVTKHQLKITFNEKNKGIQIETPKGNKVSLSDQEESIELVDVNQNKVILNKAGITLDTNGDIQLKANGNLKLSAAGHIDLKAKANVNITGMNLINTAQTSFTAKGNASAELSASGTTTVRGAMVMIN